MGVEEEGGVLDLLVFSFFEVVLLCIFIVFPCYGVVF